MGTSEQATADCPHARRRLASFSNQARRVLFGDGGEEWFSPPLLVRQHTYADNGVYTLTLTAFDNRGGRDTKSTTVTITNVAATILPGSLTGPAAPTQMIGGSVTAPIAVEFRDPAGPNDTYAVEVQCGNGLTLSSTGSTLSYEGTCTYTRVRHDADRWRQHSDPSRVIARIPKLLMVGVTAGRPRL